MGNGDKLRSELESFQSLWKGGFYLGDPRDPLFGLWGITAFMGMSHALYLGCIRPNVTPQTNVLEIGCGRGAYSKLMTGARTLYCVDALSAEHNGFWDYVGRHENVHYVQTQDFSLDHIPDDSLDFSFSYDALCHVSLAGITRYAQNLMPKLKRGGHAIWMVADYEKFNRFIDNKPSYSVLNAARLKRTSLLRKLVDFAMLPFIAWHATRTKTPHQDIREDDEPRPGRWYNAGRAATCAMLREVGYEVLDEDMGFDFRSPVIHFAKR